MVDERVFGLIAAGEGLPEGVADSVARLVALGFVKIDPECGNRPVALNPRDVADRRMREMLRENEDRLRAMQELPELTDALASHFDRAQWRAGGGSEYIDDAAVVNARLDDVVGHAQEEILSAHPGGPRTAEQLERSLTRDAAALDRGVVKRTLYRATVRDTAVTAQYVRAMANRPAGRRARFATLVGPFERCIVVDRRTAFVSNHLVEGAPEHSAWQVTDRAMVAYIVAEFEAKWRQADPWRGELRGRTGGVVDGLGLDGVRTSPRQREIMRDMVAGKDQRATASRLGVSERTVTNEITQLKDMFDATSREQLAFAWAFSTDRTVDDSAPADDVTSTGAEAAA
ncbi:LuxR C-terminal-related transcriptional regulator [Streptomyces pseudovenezuelae]|uniref:LuxR C-terminal-related transcriptional regulator n=1 Tax=Streptomyces pseudovenezuelae TaxID=67350 RepID=UPI002E81C6AE|nr:LuxR C-terminal-related transcriptional regulator [Streptomyces pseudovenezuelae]WUA94497.1 LuxR family transcriptional regulator [Streptomyces pseudovenezuelae]